MITCPACGTDNREWASHCGECGKPLPEDARPRTADVDAPRTERLPAWLRQDAEKPPRTAAPDRRGQAMPPIPDGGLADTMPSWLGDTSREARTASASPPPTRQRASTPEETPDVTTFLSPEDLPNWLRRLAEIESRANNAPAAPSPPLDVTATGPLIGDEPDFHHSTVRHDAATASTKAAPVDHGLHDSQPQPLARRAKPLPGEKMPAPASPTDRQLTAAFLTVVAISAAMIAYAVYLAVTG